MNFRQIYLESIYVKLRGQDHHRSEFTVIGRKMSLFLIWTHVTT